MKCYSAIKRINLIHATIWMNFENIMLILQGITLMRITLTLIPIDCVIWNHEILPTLSFLI